MKNKIQIIFFGTHNFAKTILQKLLKSKTFEIKLVVTQPDRPVGRKKIMTPPPVKKLALKHKLEVAQFENLKNTDEKKFSCDIGITAQYGILVPKKILQTPKFGILNVHTSLLPKYRGASPIQTAIANGDKKTGITIIKMDEGLDTGDIIAQKTIKIDKDENFSDLEKRLADSGGELLSETIPLYIAKKIKPKKQNEKKSSYCGQLSKKDGKIDWRGKTNEQIYNLFRGLTPWPGIWTEWNNKKIKILKIAKSNEKLKPGEIKFENEKIFIGCKTGSLQIIELQPEGKKEMKDKDFINGYSQLNNQNLS